MISVQTLNDELTGLAARTLDAGKRHISVRWESAPAIVRVGLMIEHYDWDNRMHAIRMLRDFEISHADEFALEYDIVPFEPVMDENFAEA